MINVEIGLLRKHVNRRRLTQGFMLDWVFGHLHGNERAVVCAALKRMGLRDSPADFNPLCWELLDWFVKYAQLDFDMLTAEQCSECDEEIQVIQLLGSWNFDPWIPSRLEMKELQARVLKIVSELVDAKSTIIGPIPVEFVIWRGQTRQKDLLEGQKAKGVFRIGRIPNLVGHPPAEGISFQLPPVGSDAVIHCLALLLQKYPGAVRRCRECKKLFTRVKYKSGFDVAVSCSRKCQTRSYEREAYRKMKEAAHRRKEHRQHQQRTIKAKRRGRSVRHATKKRK